MVSTYPRIIAVAGSARSLSRLAAETRPCARRAPPSPIGTPEVVDAPGNVRVPAVGVAFEYPLPILITVGYGLPVPAQRVKQDPHLLPAEFDAL